MFKLFFKQNMAIVSAPLVLALSLVCGAIACGDQERLSVGSHLGLAEQDAQVDATASTTQSTFEAGALGLQIAVDGAVASAHTLCQGQCVELSTRVQGALSSVSYEWSEGAPTDAASIRVCPLQNKTIAVAVTEAGAGSELAQPRRASATLSLEVRDCQDAGNDPMAEAGTTPALCLKNASFEDVAETGSNFRTHEWKPCHEATYTMGDDRLFYSDIPLLPPAHGTKFVGLHASLSNASLALEKPSISQALCRPMRVNEPHVLRMAALSYEVTALIPLPNDRARIQLFGSMTECEAGELLWQSDYILGGTQWQSLCASFTPKQAYRYLRVGIETDDGNGRLVTLDDLRPVAARSCE